MANSSTKRLGVSNNYKHPLNQLQTYRDQARVNRRPTAPSMPYMYRLSLLVIACLWTYASTVAHAQAEPKNQPPAEVWLTYTFKEQRILHAVGRYGGAPLNVAFGAGVALFPALVDTSVASSIAYVSSGAFMLTSAISLWANEDPYEGRRQYSIWTSLGFSALGAGLMLSCVTADDACHHGELGRRLQVGVGVFETGFFVSNALLALLMPPPSASALELSVKTLGAPERNARMIEYLERRDRQRRVASYFAAPWGLGFGGYLLAEGAGADNTEGKVWLYTLGASLLAFNLVAFLYEQLRRGDADRLRAGEYP